jgi:tetratricopeptide (TPR) repeat protein
MHNELRQQIHDNLNEKSTDYLLDIWQNGDPEEWDEVTFEVVGEILRERLEELPPRPDRTRAAQLLKQVETGIKAEAWDSALTACQLATEIAPDLPLAHYYLGILYDQLGQLESARSSLKQALRLDPDLKDARVRLGYIEQDLAAAPPDPEVGQDLVQAMVLIDQGKPDQALKLAEKVAPGMPDLAINHYYLGVIYDESDQMEPALASLQKAVQLDPDLKEAWDLLECVEAELGAEFEDSEARQHLVLACEYVDAGEPEKALMECDLVKKTLPDIAIAWNFLGLIYQGSKKLDLAIEAYLKAIQLNPRFHPARTNLANARVLLEEERYHLIARGSEIAETDLISPDIDPDTVPEYEGNDGLAPQWLYLSESAYLLRGWAGHRNRSGRIGLDPLDTDFEQAHIEGTIIHKLITFKLRTRNPVYLALMILAGLSLSLPFVFMVPLTMMMLIEGEISFYLELFIYSPLCFVGITSLLNVFLSIVIKKGADAVDDGSSFY